MKFSLITPEHNESNIPYLIELYESIKTQTYTNWEWIVYANNGFDPNKIPQFIIDDPQVRIYFDDEHHANIGQIKNNAFNLGEGDILVEADHDDLLTPDCLEELYKAYQDDSVGFVYSDNAILPMGDIEFNPYGVAYGWSHRMYNYRGKELFAMNSFEPSSKAVSFIWYAPDHVRSWRKTVYDAVGGHDINEFVCDDHQLMIKTYLHSKMKRIPKVLYIYRLTGSNTCYSERNEAIQIRTVELFRQYAMQLAIREADLNGLMKIDIGAGINPLEGFITVDNREQADFNFDLNEGLPFADNSVGVLNASHILEHLKDPIKSMKEIHRVLAHGGWAFIEVPSTDGRGAFQDPTHVSFWNENSFMYYTNANLAKYLGNTGIRFQKYRVDTHFPNEWMRSINSCVTSAWLCAVKDDGERLPGLLEI
jgi:O-antigen biosynthesis protein